MKSDSSIVSWVVVLMAACSLFSMIGTFEIDGIINHDLYKYGLQFSYAWAVPYWNLAGFVFAMGWFNIVAAMVVQVYRLARRRKASGQTASEAKREMTQTKTVQEPKEEKPKPTEPSKEPEDVQVSVLDTNAQEKEEIQTNIEDTPNQGNPHSGQVEEQGKQESQSPQEPETKREETEPETPKECKEIPVLPGSSDP